MGVVLEKTETIPSLLEKELIKIINKDISDSNDKDIREEIYHICGIIRLIEKDNNAYVNPLSPYLVRRDKFLIFIGKLKTDYFFKPESIIIEDFWQDTNGKHLMGLHELTVDIHKPSRSNIEYLRSFRNILSQMHFLCKMRNDNSYRIISDILENNIIDLIDKL